MGHTSGSRRDFLLHVPLAMAVPLVFGCRGQMAAQDAQVDVLAAIKKNAIQDASNEWWGAKDAPANVASTTVLRTDADKGETLRVSGTVYRPDGKTPAPAVLVYLYHTDVYGIYGRTGEHRHGRYRGWMLTDAQGRYEFETIIPASYPNSTTAAHIHMTLTGQDFKEDWVDSILFEGDRFLTERDRAVRKGGFDPVLRLTKAADGARVGERNIRLAA